MSSMKKILLSPNPYRDKGFKCALAAKNTFDVMGIEAKICLPFNVDKSFELPQDIALYDLTQELPGSDLLVCFGGDGTILHSSKLATLNNVPILSVNVGTMGFMAELESTELAYLYQIAEGNFTLDERLMLDVVVKRAGVVIARDIALNDAVVTKGAIAREIQVSVLCDSLEALSYSGDGVIVCTPTGSTAYSMSAGGPIVEPLSKNIIVTPICAHTLHAKPFVLSDEREVSIRIGRLGRKFAYLSVDGGKAVKLNSGDLVVTRRSAQTTKLVRVKNLSFFKVINSKFKN